MDLLKAEIEKKRKLLETVQTAEQRPKKKKYVRRADLEKIREQQYLTEQSDLERKREVFYIMTEIPQFFTILFIN